MALLFWKATRLTQSGHSQQLLIVPSFSAGSICWVTILYLESRSRFSELPVCCVCVSSSISGSVCFAFFSLPPLYLQGSPAPLTGLLCWLLHSIQRVIRVSLCIYTSPSNFLAVAPALSTNSFMCSFPTFSTEFSLLLFMEFMPDVCFFHSLLASCCLYPRHLGSSVCTCMFRLIANLDFVVDKWSLDKSQFWCFPSWVSSASWASLFSYLSIKLSTLSDFCED